MTLPDIWVEKYRPKTISEYVFKNNKLKEEVQSWIDNEDNKTIPIGNLLLVGKAGVGKTSLAKMIFNELNISKYDILELNGSDENGVDIFRDKVKNFVSTYPIGEYKVVFIDEADALTTASQNILRNMIEKHTGHVRFVMTGNYVHKFSEPMLSRFSIYTFETLDLSEFLNRVINVLQEENVTFDIEHLERFVEASYPDLRKCLGLLDQHTKGKILSELEESSTTTLDYMGDVIEMFKKRKYKEARQHLSKNADISEYEEIYKFMYKNLHLFSDNSEGQSQALIIISEGLEKHGHHACSEMNLSATITRLRNVS